MKSVKEMDERQQLLYYKLKSRIFDMFMVELFLGLLIWSIAGIPCTTSSLTDTQTDAGYPL